MWACLAGAQANDAATLQRIHELAWQRADALILAGQIPGADGPTRAEAARALGHLGTPEARVVLEDLRSDRDLDVQVAVAEALGWVPGGRQVVRDWLDELGAPGFNRLDPGVRRYGTLVRSLGATGDSPDIPRMVAALGEPWPVASIAAGGLEAMAARRVPGVDEAATALVSRLRGPDPRVVADAARALASVGLGQAAPSDVAFVRHRLRRGTAPAVQADLIRAVWPALSPEDRSELFLTSATDTARHLRVAALEVLEPGDLPADVLSTFLVDGDPWIRHAAVAALARDPSPEATAALGRHGREAPPHDAAMAIRALGVADRARASDLDEPVAIRVALVALERDHATLERWAHEDPEPAVRSAAARALAASGPTTAFVRLLEAGDPVVRWIAVRALGERGGTRETQRQLLGESDHRVLTEALRALTAARRGVTVDRSLRTVLVRAAASESPALRSAGLRFAAAVGLPWPDARPVELPDVVEARRIRGAVVVTERGRFRLGLEPGLAPLAVAQWATLAESGFYDGLPILSAEPAGEVRTGCPRGDGLGDAGAVFPTELSTTAFRAGAVALAVHPLGGVASQWFLTTGDRAHRTEPHVRIGRVVDGQHVVDRLEAGDQIVSVTIERVAP